MLLEEFDMEEFLRMDRRDERAAGRAEGKAEGERIGLAKSVIQILGMKYDISSDIQDRILAEQHTDVLEDWVRLAVQSSVLEDFTNQMT